VPVWVAVDRNHAALIVALCIAIKPYSHGAADAQYGSMGIVLHRTSNSNTGATGEADRPIVSADGGDHGNGGAAALAGVRGGRNESTRRN